jgi:hypothetical protein
MTKFIDNFNAKQNLAESKFYKPNFTGHSHLKSTN